MAEGKDVVSRPNGTSGNGHASGSDRPEQIAADIDRTRSSMDRTVDAIMGKLTPSQLMLEAAGVLRTGSSSVLEKVVETAREHPLPATIIAAGIGMLLMERNKGEEERDL